MTIDLSTLNPGDTVIHRNGGRSVIFKTEPHKQDGNWIYLYFKPNCTFTICYPKDGSWTGTTAELPFDIIAIEPTKEKKTPLEIWLDKPYLEFKNELDILNHIRDLGKATQQTLREMRG